MDTDCTGNAVHKCCPEHNSGLNVCVKPVPGRLAFSEEGRKTVNISFFAILQWSQHYIKMSIFTACRDGKKVNARDVFEQKCAEVASEYCIDRGCEDGPMVTVNGVRPAAVDTPLNGFQGHQGPVRNSSCFISLHKFPSEILPY